MNKGPFDLRNLSGKLTKGNYSVHSKYAELPNNMQSNFGGSNDNLILSFFLINLVNVKDLTNAISLA